MENSNQENKVNQDPKPSDQVQLEIETVTPETEKDVVPTTDENPADKTVEKTSAVAKDKETSEDEEPAGQPNASDQSSNSESNEAKTDDVETVTPDKAQTENTVDADETESTTEQETVNEKTDEGDQRDQIETVSP